MNIDWIMENWEQVLIIIIGIEKIINTIVGITETRADDKAWAKLKTVLGHILNTKVKST